MLGFIGSMLLTTGTLFTHVVFIVSQRNIYLVSDMFKEWPIASSATFGIGNTILGMALFDTNNIHNSIIIISGIASSWLVILSSDDNGKQFTQLIHAVSTVYYIYWSMFLYTVALKKENQHHDYLLYPIALCSVVAIFNGILLFVIQDHYAKIVYRYMMAVAEMSLFALYMIGYQLLFHKYLLYDNEKMIQY